MDRMFKGADGGRLPSAWRFGAIGLVPADTRKAAQHFAGLVAVGRDPGAD
jgi:hypothetical protein